MALSILQQPELNVFSQSPIICAVSESNAEAYTSSSFQIVGEFRYWQGNQFSSSVDVAYTLNKFPNNSGSAIFDFSRIAASLFTEPRAAESSSVYWAKGTFYHQYKESPSGSFITGSKYATSEFAIFDGYQKFQQGIQTSTNPPGRIISSSEFWPIMTDGPTSQSYFRENYGRMSIWRGTQQSTLKEPIALIFSASAPTEDQSVVLHLTASEYSDEMVATFPISPLEPDWPLDSDPDNIGNFEIFAIKGPATNYDGTNRITQRLHFDLECTKKYPNVRVKWKNRFGQWDYFNFNLVSTEQFNTQRSKYQPQIGSWDSRTLTYEDYESAIQNYIADETLKITVNTDYIDEGYNETFKQLMLSDEIYWVYEEGSELNNTEKLKPIAIDDTSFNLKTGVVNKLIQYTFTFTQGQGYKLIF